MDKLSAVSSPWVARAAASSLNTLLISILLQATALLNWFDGKIAEHKQRLDEHLIEVFANVGV